MTDKAPRRRRRRLWTDENLAARPRRRRRRAAANYRGCSCLLLLRMIREIAGCYWGGVGGVMIRERGVRDFFPKPDGFDAAARAPRESCDVEVLYILRGSDYDYAGEV